MHEIEEDREVLNELFTKNLFRSENFSHVMLVMAFSYFPHFPAGDGGDAEGVGE